MLGLWKLLAVAHRRLWHQEAVAAFGPGPVGPVGPIGPVRPEAKGHCGHRLGAAE